MTETDGSYNRKYAKVMREYYEGRLRSGGDGLKVVRPDVAKAIAASEGRKVLRMKKRKS